jgi:hypothetical protein
MNLTSHTLHQLVVDLHLEETQTLDALLAQMTGDYAASRMLARILYWRDKAIKFGGWVWKSWRDWYAECGLSQGQIKRVHRDGILEQFGMARSLMKANGAPTTHYLLDEDAFMSKLADFLQMAFDEVKLRLSMIANGETPGKKRKSARKKQADSIYSDYVNDFSDITDFTFPPKSEAQQEPTTPQESTTEDADTVIDTPTFDASVLAFAEETNIAPDILQRMNMDEAQSIWTLIQSDYPKSVKHWREHNDLLAHALAGVPFADVSEELIHRVRFGHSRESYSNIYRPTVDKHRAQLRTLGLG